MLKQPIGAGTIYLWRLISASCLVSTVIYPLQSQALPTLSDEIPEEVLETEIILEGRSPLNGEPLTAAEYAQLQDELRLENSEVPGRLSPKVHRAVVLLKLRKILKTVFPFIF